MNFHKSRTARAEPMGAPRCQCGGVITRATSKGFICETCWRDDGFHAERVAEIVKRFVCLYGAYQGRLYAARLSDYFDAINDAVQSKDHLAASVMLRAREGDAG
jgi:hypothetical protein